jgi:hypothetical protein
MAKYFTLKELCASATATKMGIDNFPSFEVAAHLQDLTARLLDPLREAWGGPIRVTSGYRCTRLNTAVGGVTTSAHKLGWAADLQDPAGKTEKLIEFARIWVLTNGIKFDQLIRETDKSKKTVWLHIGLYGPAGQQRGQFLNLVKK